MATEIAFAKQFLAQLDVKPGKIGSDHVEDARNYPGGNGFLLPKYPSSPVLPKRRIRTSPSTTSTSTTTSSATATKQDDNKVSVKAISARNPPLTLRFEGLDGSTTSMLDVKQLIHEEIGVPVEKVKILFNKKPVGDTKVLKELGLTAEGKGEVELGVMVLGGVGSVPEGWKKKSVSGEGNKGVEEEKVEEKASGSVVAPGQISGVEVVKTQEFWGDLQGFLEQRVKDVGVARGLVERWRGVEGL
ncbi:cell-cycle control medial ring component [Podospora fimiseda]|uniref:Cell-cycle control medial ring component n=1 Tax=Podospora fimiseda TaxID=252190 RepID=A0AAN7BRZ6_9PEZI|nr:cell-cycle control medial ring component [Podospora fimiseda]